MEAKLIQQHAFNYVKGKQNATGEKKIRRRRGVGPGGGLNQFVDNRMLEATHGENHLSMAGEISASAIECVSLPNRQQSARKSTHCWNS